MLRLFIFASGTLGGRFKRKYTGKTDWDEDKAPFGPSAQLLLLALTVPFNSPQDLLFQKLCSATACTV